SPPGELVRIKSRSRVLVHFLCVSVTETGSVRYPSAPSYATARVSSQEMRQVASWANARTSVAPRDVVSTSFRNQESERHDHRHQEDPPERAERRWFWVRAGHCLPLRVGGRSLTRGWA